MKVTVLADNLDGVKPQVGAADSGILKGEWGLSHYIEYGDRVVLLDAGLSGLFAENAGLLGIDLENVDYAVLSHAHDDHANGFDTFFEVNSHAPLYVAEGCYENCYDLTDEGYKYAGIPQGILERHADRIVRASADMLIDDGIRLLGHSTPDLEKLGFAEKMFLKTDDETGNTTYVPDDFSHEQSLIFEQDDGVVVFNSCSHAGADNIINEVIKAYPDRRIKAMIGGFHLFNKTDEYVRAFAARVAATGVESIYTGHCTGDRALAILREELGSMVHTFRTGLEFEI